jgi:hypothetical protein
MNTSAILNRGILQKNWNSGKYPSSIAASWSIQMHQQQVRTKIANMQIHLVDDHNVAK